MQSKAGSFNYKASLSIIKGVGPKVLEKLHHCELYTFRDALFHFPIRYEDRTKISPIAQLRDGEPAMVRGRVIRLKQLNKAGKILLFVDLQDESGILNLSFFYLNYAQIQHFQTGVLLACYGIVKNRGMAHPDYYVLHDLNDPLDAHLMPIYSSTEKLYQSNLRKMIGQVLDQFLEQYGETEAGIALSLMHRPLPDTDIHALLRREHPATQFLIKEELWAQLLNLKKLKAETTLGSSFPLLANKNNLDNFYRNLSFQLTKAQERVIHQIIADLSKPQAMMRLIQGDVGSGKTVVAAVAALIALSEGKQVALMAPTEILAEQLFQNFTKWFQPFDFECVWLSGSMSAKDKQGALAKLAGHQSIMAIGTHALFQEAVIFNNLALMIIDEQHRFGVHQRLALMNKGKGVHQLVLTATPIPRTLAMTRYANLDLSIIDELPPGRKPIKTVLISDLRRTEIIQKIRALAQSGQQVYWLCTAIQETEAQEYQAAQTSFSLLASECPDCQVGLIHGQLSALEKETIMADFKMGKIHILVATTVIEVGVDVPNATLMIIENPERLGLAQLHQLRGRVGRGLEQSFCVLLYKAPLSENAKARLEILRESQDGFVIAEKDLELRGSGDVLAAKQSGLANFKIADLVRDKEHIFELHAKLEEGNNMDYYPELFERWIGYSTECQTV